MAVVSARLENLTTRNFITFFLTGIFLVVKHDLCSIAVTLDSLLKRLTIPNIYKP